MSACYTYSEVQIPSYLYIYNLKIRAIYAHSPAHRWSDFDLSVEHAHHHAHPISPTTDEYAKTNTKTNTQDEDEPTLLDACHTGTPKWQATTAAREMRSLANTKHCSICAANNESRVELSSQVAKQKRLLLVHKRWAPARRQRKQPATQ